MNPRSRYNYELALKLHPNYTKEKYRRTLELHGPGYCKLLYEYQKKLYPDYMQRHYARAKELHPDLIEKQVIRFRELHNPDERRKIWNRSKRKWRLRKKIFGMFKKGKRNAK